MRDEKVSKPIKFGITRVFIRNNVIKCRSTTILKQEPPICWFCNNSQNKLDDRFVCLMEFLIVFVYGKRFYEIDLTKYPSGKT